MPDLCNQPNQEFWPFQMPVPERQTDRDRRELRFLEAAYQEGFRPYRYLIRNFGAYAPSGREGLMADRGRGKWEVFLSQGEQRIANSLISAFDTAANTLLEGLRGSHPRDETARRADGSVDETIS